MKLNLYNTYIAQRKRTEKAKELAENVMQEDESDEEIDNENNKVSIENVFEIPSQKYEGNDLDQRIAKLNKDQLAIYNDVIETIIHQNKHAEKICTCKKLPMPIRSFCSGVAGE